MVQMQGRVAAEYDDAAGTLLADAVTHSDTRTANTAVAVDTLIQSTHAYWDNGELPMGLFWVNIHLTANAINGGADTIGFVLEAYTSSDFSTARVELARLVLTDGAANGLVGFYRMAVDAKTAQRLLANMTHLALVNTLSDAAVSVSYTAWLGFAKMS